jgi:RNA polymerase sigma-70 factor (ECF subfamily)
MSPRPTEADIVAIYRQTIGPFYAAVSRRCHGDRAMAEDVVQETWLRAVDAWRARGVPDVPAAWLSAVARNLLLNHLRRQRPVPLSALPTEPAAPSDAAAREREDIAAVINRGLGDMPRAQASVIEAFHLKEQSVAAIAADLDVSERAVEGRLRRARSALRRTVARATGRTEKRP